VIQGDHGVAACLEAFDGGAVHQDDVEAAVIIAIEEADTAAGGIDDIAGFGGSDMRSGYADLLGDVLEDGNGWKEAAIGFGFGSVWLCKGRRDGNALGASGLGVCEWRDRRHEE
jgi:hypothetical protein